MSSQNEQLIVKTPFGARGIDTTPNREQLQTHEKTQTKIGQIFLLYGGSTLSTNLLLHLASIYGAVVFLPVVIAALAASTVTKNLPQPVKYALAATAILGFITAIKPHFQVSLNEQLITSPTPTPVTTQ